MSVFLPVVSGINVGLCVGDGCPVIEPVIIRIMISSAMSGVLCSASVALKLFYIH